MSTADVKRTGIAGAVPGAISGARLAGGFLPAAEQ